MIPGCPSINNSKQELMFGVSLLADGYPYPTYEWYKENYQGDILVSRPIDPLEDRRITVSGGTLIINEPDQVFTC